MALLLKPISSADLRGGGATNLFVLDVVALFVVCLPGRGGRSGDRSGTTDGRTGSAGLAGSCGGFDRLGGGSMLGTKFRLLFMAVCIALIFFSSVLFRGWIVGRDSGLNSGTRRGYNGAVPLLVPVLLELRESSDMVEPTVRIESVDSRRFRLRLSEGLRGGRVGVTRGVPLLLVVLFRGGGRGGSAGDICGPSAMG